MPGDDEEQVPMFHLHCMGCMAVIGWTDLEPNSTHWLGVVIICPRCMSHPENIKLP